MTWGQAVLFLVVLAGSLAEGEVVIVGFAVLSVAVPVAAGLVVLVIWFQRRFERGRKEP